MANDILGTRSPNGAVGVRGVADSGELSMLSAGILSGFGVVIGSGFNLGVGGTVGAQDVAVVKNLAGESDLLVGNGSAMTFVLPGAPGTSGQSQVHSLVVWKDTTVVSTINDGLDAVGYQVVSGAAATTGTQVAPTDEEIMAEVPNGATAFVAVIANVVLNYGDPAPVASRIAPVTKLLPVSNLSGVLPIESGGTGMSAPILYTDGIIEASAGVTVTYQSATRIGNIFSFTYVMSYASNLSGGSGQFGTVAPEFAPIGNTQVGVAISSNAVHSFSVSTTGALRFVRSGNYIGGSSITMTGCYVVS